MGGYQLCSFFFLSIITLIDGGDHVGGGKVIFAVNAGGDSHVDSHGILFKKDTLKVGTASDYGKVC